MCFFHGGGNIHHGQQGKDKSLDKAGEDSQEHHRQRGQEFSGQQQEDSQNQVLSHDITEQPKGQGEYPGKMTDDLNRQHQGCHPPDGSQELLNIFKAVDFNAYDMGGAENDQGTA